jgi:magnesium chelatase subunit I
VWVSDLAGIIPAITGKIELVYEGEQEGPYQVALNLVDKAIRTQFINYFPNPEKQKKKRVVGKKSADEKPEEESMYKAITRWFDAGNFIDILVDMKDADKLLALYKVDGLFGLVKKMYPHANEREAALLMEFVLHGLASYSLISKQTIEGKIVFKDLMGSMVNLDNLNFDESDFNEEDYR